MISCYVATILVLYNAGSLNISWAVNSDKMGAILESFLPAQVNCSPLMSHIYYYAKFMHMYECACGCVDWSSQSSWKTSQHLASQPRSGIIAINVVTSTVVTTADYFKVPEIINYTMVNRTYRYFEGVPQFPFGYGLYVSVK